jgi:ubiquinone/menaquinone biosynthesis C-methylase UbiE
MSQVGKFTQPDHSGDPNYFIKFLEMVDRLPGADDVRARSYQQMRIESGTAVLDAGCGIGTAVRELANLVGPKGSASGIDISDTMITEARARAAGRANVDFCTGNICDLPYPDQSFNAVRTERVMLYLPNREKAVSEMIRVTKLGGRVVISDTDIDCTAITGKDRLQTRKITSLIADTFVNPNSARELYGLLQHCGLKDVTVEVMALQSTHEFCVHATQGAVRAAVADGKLTQAEADEWYRGLAELEMAGEFMQLWFFVIAGGTVTY